MLSTQRSAAQHASAGGEHPLRAPSQCLALVCKLLTLHVCNDWHDVACNGRHFIIVLLLQRIE